MGDDKPFACLEPDCGMCFANEDHLSVHRMKHEMSLALLPMPGKPATNLLFVDQTPTPTKFLRNCEEIGLFSELNKNPFEEAFKKATEGQHELKTEMLTVHSVVEAEALHTPTPPQHISQAQHKESPLAKRNPPSPSPAVTLKESSQSDFVPLPGPSTDTGSTISTLSPSQDSSQDMTSSGTHILPSPSSSSPRSPFVLPPKKAMLASRDFQLKQAAAAAAEAAVKPKFIVDKPNDSFTPRSVTSVMTSTVSMTTQQMLPMVTSSFSPMVCASPANNSKTVAQTVIRNSPATTPVILPTPSPSAPIVSPSPANGKQYYLQVVVQMPNGETVPVQIPAAVATTATAQTHQAQAPVAQAPVAQTPVAQTTVVSNSNIHQVLQQALPGQSVAMTTQGDTMAMTQPSSDAVISLASGIPSSYTKQKLKASIQQNVRLSIDTPQRLPLNLATINTHSPVMNSQASPALSMSPLGPQFDDDMSMDEMSSHNLYKRSRSSASDCDDPDDKRKKFLERNRAAAARCRQKKKNWIVNLEGKAEDLQTTNSKLQNEVTHLRSEVAQLKSLLLAHKDCPITQQQRSSGQLDLQTVPQLETQSDRISSTSPSSIVMETSSSSPEAIATSALTAMAAKGMVSNHHQTFTPIIINLCPNPSQPKS